MLFFKGQLSFSVHNSLSTDFRIRIMAFLTKIFFFNCFHNTDKLKKLNLVAKPFAPKSSNCCHLWAVLGHDLACSSGIANYIINLKNIHFIYLQHNVTFEWPTYLACGILSGTRLLMPRLNITYFLRLTHGSKKNI